MEDLGGVLIVGAGPVGMVTAIKLARAGIPVTVLEKEAEIVESPRALAYFPPMLEALDKLGLLDDAKDIGSLLLEYAFRTPDGTSLSKADFSVIEDDTPYPYTLTFGQHQLVEIIARHLEPLPEARVRWSHRVTGLAQDENGVTVSVETPEETKQIRAPWLVATDGAGSTVREALRLAFAGFTWPEMFVASNVYYDFEAYGYSTVNYIVDPEHWAVIVKASKDGLWRIAYGEDPDASQEEIEGRLPEKYAHLLPGSASYEVARVNPYRAHQRAADSFRVGRVLLAGDAAHVTNPVGGLGLMTGLLDAEALGDALAANINGDAADGILDEYAQDRRNVFLDYTSPLASDNKRRISETDPDRQEEDMKFLRRLDEDRQRQREFLLYLANLKGKSFAPSSS